MTRTLASQQVFASLGVRPESEHIKKPGWRCRRHPGPYIAQPAVRQLFIKALRSSPFKVFSLAWALQAFIFSFCPSAAAASAGAEAGAAAPPERQVFMNALRSSPLRAWVFASTLQPLIFSRCASCLALGAFWVVASCAKDGCATSSVTAAVAAAKNVLILNRYPLRSAQMRAVK